MRAEVPVPQGLRSIAFSPENTALRASAPAREGASVQSTWLTPQMVGSSGGIGSIASRMRSRTSRLKWMMRSAPTASRPA